MSGHRSVSGEASPQQTVATEKWWECYGMAVEVLLPIRRLIPTHSKTRRCLVDLERHSEHDAATARLLIYPFTVEDVRGLLVTFPSSMAKEGADRLEGEERVRVGGLQMQDRGCCWRVRQYDGESRTAWEEWLQRGRQSSIKEWVSVFSQAGINCHQSLTGARLVMTRMNLVCVGLDVPLGAVAISQATQQCRGPAPNNESGSYCCRPLQAPQEGEADGKEEG